jgi:hypothetical protein
MPAGMGAGGRISFFFGDGVRHDHMPAGIGAGGRIWFFFGDGVRHDHMPAGIGAGGGSSLISAFGADVRAHGWGKAYRSTKTRNEETKRVKRPLLLFCFSIL